VWRRWRWRWRIGVEGRRVSAWVRLCTSSRYITVPYHRVAYHRDTPIWARLCGRSRSRRSTTRARCWTDRRRTDRSATRT
jgi:hypothetical protein